MKIILQNPQLNFAEFYAATDLIFQPQPSSPQPSCPQLQLPPPQQLPYNNIYLNNLVSSYNNLETQDLFDIYTSYTQLLSENDFFMPNKPHLTNKTILHPPLRHLHMSINLILTKHRK